MRFIKRFTTWKHTPLLSYFLQSTIAVCKAFSTSAVSKEIPVFLQSPIRNLRNPEANFKFTSIEQIARRYSYTSSSKMSGSSVPYVGTSVRGITKEIEIPAPWGIIASKVYGDSSNPPVLCIHGWLDNCNTFDKLIPLLPEDKFYVFIDLPGHGLSSRFPIGMFYTSFDFVAIVDRVANYFEWTTFSLLSHSLGGNISAIYSGTFPEKVDKLILLDVFGIFPMNPGYESGMLRSSIVSYAKFENQQDKPPPTYTYETAKKKLMTANKSLSEEGADILLERGAMKMEDGRFAFIRDIRHNYRNPTGVGVSTGIHFLTNITAETMHIVASDGVLKTISEDRKQLVANLMSEGFQSCELHQYIEVEGMHHVHLCNPENITEHVTSMLQRPPRSGLSNSNSSSLVSS